MGQIIGRSVQIITADFAPFWHNLSPIWLRFWICRWAAGSRRRAVNAQIWAQRQQGLISDATAPKPCETPVKPRERPPCFVRYSPLGAKVPRVAGFAYFSLSEPIAQGLP